VTLVLGSVVGLWLLAERWLLRYPLDGPVWRTLRMAADASFGFYLAHMVTLLLITREPLLSILPTDKLPVMQATVSRLAIVIVGTVALVWLIRKTPLSRVLTGRPGTAPRTSLGA
jgi:surface polysaccharide O-acyltransferase-like enzyme